MFKSGLYSLKHVMQILKKQQQCLLSLCISSTKSLKTNSLSISTAPADPETAVVLLHMGRGSRDCTGKLCSPLHDTKISSILTLFMARSTHVRFPGYIAMYRCTSTLHLCQLSTYAVLGIDIYCTQTHTYIHTAPFQYAMVVLPFQVQ